MSMMPAHTHVEELSENPVHPHRFAKIASTYALVGPTHPTS